MVKSFILQKDIANFRTMKRFLSFLLVPILLAISDYPLFCQELSLSEMKAQLDTMFAGLDKSKIPTGFLWDTAVNLIEREGYNGCSLTDSNYVSLSLMCDMLYSINSACVSSDTLFAHAAIKRLKRNSSSTHQMVGVLFQPYNYIVDNALTDNLIVYSNNRVSDSYIGGIWQNPYDEDVLFGYALGYRGAISSNATFTITNIDTLSARSFQSILFDPGDGGGYRSVSFGNVLMANYDEGGYHTTRLKVSYGGQEYQSHGLVYVESPASAPNGHQCPHKKDGLPSITFHDVDAYYGDVQYFARVTYAPSLGFDNPLIVAEGFDPWRLMDGEEDTVHTYSGFTDYYDVACDSCAYFSFPGYALFYIDWYDAGADIRANAEVLKTVIRWVNENKTSGNKNIVLGQSMGGLIARYALRDMERHNESHDTKIYISHDAPHLGANVSPGLLYLYWDAMGLTNNLFSDAVSILFNSYDDLKELRKLGNYQSVKQMLSLYMDSSQSYNTTQYNDLRSSLSMQELPKGDSGFPIDNVAIVNGGNLDLTDSYVNGNKLFFAQAKISVFTIEFFIDLMIALVSKKFNIQEWKNPIIYTYSFEWSVFPYQSNNSLIYSIAYEVKKRFTWKSPQVFHYNLKTHLSPSYGIPFDGVSSSYYLVDNSGVAASINLGDYTALNLKYAKRIPFIPTASALMMSGSNAFHRDFYLNKPSPFTETPFSAYILNQNGSNHISFFNGISSWLQEIPEASIEGPNIAFSGDVFSISPSYCASSFSWYTSNSSATVNASTGEITITKSEIADPDLVDIVAKKENSNSVISKKKKILAGLPKVVISSSHSGTKYDLRAVFTDDGVEDFLTQTHLTDSIMRKWYLEVGGVKIDSTFSNKDTASFYVLDSVRLATVSLVLSYHGRTSEPVYLTIKEKRSYIWNVLCIWRMEDGAHYFLNVRFRPDNDNPPFFKMKSNPMETNTPLPAKLKATAGNTILRTTGDLEIVNGVVIWDLFTETAVYQLINQAYHTIQEKELIIEVYKAEEETDANLVQTIVIPIIPINPLVPLND